MDMETFAKNRSINSNKLIHPNISTIIVGHKKRWTLLPNFR